MSTHGDDSGGPQDEADPRQPDDPATGPEPDDPATGPEEVTANDPEPYPGPRRGIRIGRMGARIATALVSVAALLVTGYAYTVVSTLQESVHTTGELLQQDNPQAPPEQDGAIDILLVGTDARTDMQGNPLPPEMLRLLNTERSPGLNTDTLIVLRLPRDGGNPTAVSIPRDTWVKVPRGGMGKINSVYGVTKARTARRLRTETDLGPDEIFRRSSQAGRKALIKTVHRFTRIRIDHYAEVNLLGFYLLTKALGGVTVCLKAPTHDPDSGAHFQAGVQELSAAEALSFVRQRKNIPGGGLGRIRRQQAFLAAALREVLSAGTLTDMGKLRKLADAIRRSVVLDPDLDIIEFAKKIRDIASGDVSFVTIPVVTISGRSPQGLSIVKVDVAEVRAFMDSLVESAPPPSGGGGSPTARVPAKAADIPCVY